MATKFLAPDPIQSTQFIPGGNVPANGGQLFFYAAGTSTKQTAYKDNAGAVSWTNPIVLDSGGNLPSGGEVWFTQGQTYRVVFAPATDTDPPASPYWSKDNLAGTNDTTLTGTGEWTAGPTPTFISATQFRVSGDLRTTFDVGRRVQATVTGPPTTVYETISSVSFTAGSTNVGLNTSNSNGLDAGLSAVNYSVLSGTNPSVPMLLANAPILRDFADNTKTVAFNLTSVASSTQVSLSVQNSSGALALLSQLYVPQGYTNGFRLTNSASSDAMDIGSGQATDSGNAINITTAGLTRKTTAAFSTGASSGAKLSAAAMANNTWYAWYVLYGSSGAVDFGFDTTFPPGTPTTTVAFPFFRYIGARKTTSSTTAWDQFASHVTPSGEYVNWGSPGGGALDINTGISTGSRGLYRVNMPPINGIWYGRSWANPNAGSTQVFAFTDPAGADVAPSATGQNFPLSDVGATAVGSNILMNTQVQCWSSTGTIGIRQGGNSASGGQVVTIGWYDPRTGVS